MHWRTAHEKVLAIKILEMGQNMTDFKCHYIHTTSTWDLQLFKDWSGLLKVFSQIAFNLCWVLYFLKSDHIQNWTIKEFTVINSRDDPRWFSVYSSKGFTYIVLSREKACHMIFFTVSVDYFPKTRSIWVSNAKLQQLKDGQILGLKRIVVSYWISGVGRLDPHGH